MQQHSSVSLDFSRPEILHRNSSVKNPTYATGQIHSRPECLNDRITYLFITRDYLHSFMLGSIYQNDYLMIICGNSAWKPHAQMPKFKILLGRLTG